MRSGSSPHTRGAPAGTLVGALLGGIIPAYAGSTFSSMRASSLPRDHPRIRGEHDVFKRVRDGQVGSSPHTRGALLLVRLSGKPTRIIPAYAGSTISTSPGPTVTVGSSPHTRGALRRVLPLVLATGIIPAYAGSTSKLSGGITASGDHPRIRGEHHQFLTPDLSHQGSSPHTRGAPRHGRGARPRPGIIPAYAGSTRSGTWRTGSAWDHPRIRGEHWPMVAMSRLDVGSSPHTRGAPRCFRLCKLDEGIIPAYAGSTLGGTDGTALQKDHPRIRGEHCWSV